MVMKKASQDTDQISRSLLQKAIRRGDIEMTKKAINYIIKNADFDWLRKRLAVVTFEECWTYGLEVSYDKNEEVITNHYLKIAKSVKNKNAAGLGSLAYALSEGDKTVFTGEGTDRAIKIIGEAIKRPKDFWEWTKNQNTDERGKKLVENADKGFRKAGWPWDRAFAQSAAYLAITDGIPETDYTETRSELNFPYWVGIDKHTQEGKQAIREAAKQIGFNANKALWLAFYFESAECNEIKQSPWWEREINWRLNKLELTKEVGESIWEQLKPIVIKLLKNETQKLKERIEGANYNLTKISKNYQTSLF
jgi:hypothetical protein